MTKYNPTPGPWEIKDNGLIYGQVADAGDEAPFVADVIGGKDARFFGIMSESERANAQLIAAAPELLDATKAALDYLTDHAIDLEGEPEELLAGIRLGLADAIAKAKGGAA